MSPRPWMIVVGALLSLLSVVFGAFAAHALKNNLDSYALSIFKTAVDYQMFHGIAIFLTGLLTGFWTASDKWLTRAAAAFLTGCVFFSGSLYILALTGIKWLGVVTPIGGLAFIIGWLMIIVSATKNSKKSTN